MLGNMMDNTTGTLTITIPVNMIIRSKLVTVEILKDIPEKDAKYYMQKFKEANPTLKVTGHWKHTRIVWM